MLKVSKKDKQLEDFDRKKIISGAQKAGASPQTAEAVAVEVENWLPYATKDGVIFYQDLKYKVIEVLRSKDPKAADNFAAFRKKK